MIDLEQGVVSLIGATADGVADKNHSQTEIDGAHDRRQHANIRLRTRDDETVGPPLP